MLTVASSVAVAQLEHHVNDVGGTAAVPEALVNGSARAWRCVLAVEHADRGWWFGGLSRRVTYWVSHLRRIVGDFARDFAAFRCERFFARRLTDRPYDSSDHVCLRKLVVLAEEVRVLAALLPLEEPDVVHG